MMSLPTFFLFSIFVVLSTSTYVPKKDCADVDRSMCDVHSVEVDPCPKGLNFCPVKTGKKYDIAVKYTPHFDANELTYSVYGDVQNTGNFDTVYTYYDNPCSGFQCPVVPDMTVEGHIPLVIPKATEGKFPIRVKFWDKNSTSEACCFTFNVKVRK